MVSNILKSISDSKVTSIIRGVERDKILNVVEALHSGGIKSVEITLDTKGALGSLEIIKKEYGDRMAVGAGTVLDSESARLAILSGADFILSPTLSAKVIETCNRYSKLAVPGVLTPTEILTAWEAGSQLVKVFPAGALGPGYIKQIKGPLSQVQVMAVGGVDLENASEYIKSGALAVGIGSHLVSKELVENDRFELIKERAEKLMQAMNAVKE